MIRSAFISFAVFLAFLANAAGSQDNSSPETAMPSSTNSEETDLVAARVSGQPITEKQITAMINDLAGQMRLPLNQLQQRNSLLFKDAINNLIAIALLKNQVRQQNLSVDKALVDQQILQISKRFPSQEDFQKGLSSQGLTEARLRQNLEESIGLQLVIDGAAKNVPQVADAEIEKFYNENPGKFPVPERVHAAHILLTAESNSTAEQKAEIKKKLEAIYADITEKTISFADAAAKYSQDKSTAAKGGDLGLFIRGSMAKPFEDAAFSTTPGTMSPIIETPFGYHIIQTIDLKPAGKASLEEAKPAIKQYLEQTAKQAARQKFVEELKGKASIEFFMTQEEFVKRHPVDSVGSRQ